MAHELYNAARRIAAKLECTPAQARARGAIDDRTWAGFQARQRELAETANRRRGHAARPRPTSGDSYVRRLMSTRKMSGPQLLEAGLITQADLDDYRAKSRAYVAETRRRKRESV